MKKRRSMVDLERRLAQVQRNFEHEALPSDAEDREARDAIVAFVEELRSGLRQSVDYRSEQRAAQRVDETLSSPKRPGGADAIDDGSGR